MPETATVAGLVERFLNYVKFDTQSDGNSRTYPSTAKQLALLDRLVQDLREVGLTDAVRDQHGYVMATIPATTKKINVPVIGFLAHVDTSPEMSGENVKPIVHRAWKGADITLPDDPTMVLRVSEIPALREQIGNDIITASGRTLLGADNKAGVAEIVAAAEYLIRHPEIPHGTIRVAFTPDEEVGGGTTHFDVERFGAEFAYTVDSGTRGQVERETFSADAMTVTFRGFNTHPGYAKDKMLNSIKVAADFIHRLPKDRLSPETTDDRDGFMHPNAVDASVEQTTVRFIIRDFVNQGLAEKEALVERLARETVAAWPGASVTVEVTETYRNLREIIDQHPKVFEYARDAIARSGIEVRETAIRGGTDGSHLSFKGLPTANIFAGENNIHSRLEWVSVQDMEKAVETILNICRIWEERA